MITKINQIELFRTSHGVVYQCNRQNCYLVEFAGNRSSFKVHDFQILKKQIEAINIPEMVYNTARAADIVVLMPYRSERCFVLTLTDVFHLRELLQGAKVMMELNSILHECLHATLV